MHSADGNDHSKRLCLRYEGSSVVKAWSAWED